ncbi:MAG: DHHA1 domain-containing protein, partial [Ruthenibacterium sp.]
IRRIESTTGYGVLRLLNEQSDLLAQVAGNLKVSGLHELAQRSVTVMADLKAVQKELDELKAEMAGAKMDGLFESATDVDGVKIFTLYLTGTAPDALRTVCDKTRDKAPKSVTAVIGESEGKLTLCVSYGKDAQARGLAAGKLVKEIAVLAGGNGGGKPDFAMAGIKDASKIDDALNAVPGIVSAALAR